MSAIVLLGVIIALVMWGVGGVLDKLALNAMGGLSPLTAVIARMPVAVLVVGGAGWYMGMWDDLHRMEPVTFIYLGVSALLAAVLGQVAYFFAAGGGEISKVVVFTSAWPLVTVFVAAAWLGESLAWQKLLGTALVIGGLIVLTIPGKAAQNDDGTVSDNIEAKESS